MKVRHCPACGFTPRPAASARPTARRTTPHCRRWRRGRRPAGQVRARPRRLLPRTPAGSSRTADVAAGATPAEHELRLTLHGDETVELAVPAVAPNTQGHGARPLAALRVPATAGANSRWALRKLQLAAHQDSLGFTAFISTYRATWFRPATNGSLAALSVAACPWLVPRHPRPSYPEPTSFQRRWPIDQ